MMPRSGANSRVSSRAPGRPSVRGRIAALLALLSVGGLVPLGRLAGAQVEVPVAGVTGDQLVFFFDARTNRVPFLSISNPSSTAVSVDVAFYPASLASPLGRATLSIAGAGNVVVDPTGEPFGGIASGQAGLAIVTPVAGGGSLVPVVPPQPLAGAFTLANTALQAAFGENGLGRLAVDAGGNRAASGTAVDGVSIRYQRLAPSVLTIPTYFNPQNLAPPDQDGNRIVLAAFSDTYGTSYTATPASRNLTATFFSALGGLISSTPLAVNGVRLTDLQEAAGGASLTSSGKVFFSGTSGAGNLLGIFSQSLGTFASGQRMPAVASVPAPGVTPSPGVTPTPTPTAGTGACGNGVVDGDEECDGSDLGGQTCDEVVGFGVSCGGSLACSASCTLVLSGCSCPCSADDDCAALVDCTAVVPECELDGACVGGTCFTGGTGSPAICNGNEVPADPEDPVSRCFFFEE